MRILLMLSLLCLGACHDGSPPAPDAADNAQLDEAGNMLDNLANADANAN